ncbi:hypothetical protein [Clostridium sp.]|jgi:hypothetical protein|uniref:hypothetical protein n=1 Tax=Clostridium sp. TaxID=1506 RepID=UPI003EEDBFE1
MKKTSLRMKILSATLCTGLALSSTSVSFAEARQSGSLNEVVATSMDFKASVDNEKEGQGRFAEMKGTLEIVIKEGVLSNTITADEGKKVLEFVATRSEKRSGEDKDCKNCKDEKGGLFNELVDAKILTQEKSDALRDRMYLKKTQIRSEQLQRGLNILVDKKVLTPEQKEKVKKAIRSNDAQRKENYSKMKGMTKKQIKAHIKEMKKKNINPMKALIENGTITKEQEEEIQKILPSHNHKHGHDNKKN